MAETNAFLFMLKRTTRKSLKQLGSKRLAKSKRGSSPKQSAAAANSPVNGASSANGNGQLHADAEVDAKLKELIQLAQDQGYLTYDDINDALPDALIAPDELDNIYTKLREKGIQIVENAEAQRTKFEPAENEPEEENPRLDILDDPVQMYMNQMGKTPLLTREQEVEICQRIEGAENRAKHIIHRFGFAGKEHITLAEKLLADPPQERFDRIIADKKLGFRDAHLRQLRKLIKKVRVMDRNLDKKYLEWTKAKSKSKSQKLANSLQKLNEKLEAVFPDFHYRPKFLEELTAVAANIHESIHLSSTHIENFSKRRKSTQQQALIDAEAEKIENLEKLLRMPKEDFLAAFNQLKKAR
jgi:RNA polymerase primary sigma factor